MKVNFLIPPVLDGTGNVDRWIGCNYSFYFLPIPAIMYCATILKSIVDKVAISDLAARGSTQKDFIDFVSKDNSDIYIFYTVFLSQKIDLLARKAIREAKPDAKFIFCGPQPTLTPELFLDKDDTFVVRGEPEFIVEELVAALKNRSAVNGIHGLSYLDVSKIVNNPSAELIEDIDRVPIPDRTLLDNTLYCNPKLGRGPHTSMLTSRGCYGKCWFCVPNSLSYCREVEYKKNCGVKPPPRLHSARRVIEEFRDIARLGIKSISILDDEFLWDEKRTIEICAGIKPLKLEWSCITRPDMVTEKAAQAMREAGCVYADLGTESFDEGILESIRKEMSPLDTERAVAILKRNKIQVEINVLFGATPKETEATMKKTLKSVKKLNPDYVLFNIANPYPGTDFYEAAKKEGWMVYGDYVPSDAMKDSIISYPHLSKEKLERFIAHAYLTYYYMNPKYILKQLSGVRSPAEFMNKFSAAARFFMKNFIKRHTE